MKKLIACLMLMSLVCPVYSAGGTPISAPIDNAGWNTCVDDAKTSTPNPYIPKGVSINISRSISMSGYTGVIVRAKYLTAGSMSTDPVIAAWGSNGSNWQVLKDINGNRTTTLSDNATTDCDDGATYKWTDASEKIDALGCDHVLITVITAAVSAAGAVTLEIKRY